MNLTKYFMSSSMEEQISSNMTYLSDKSKDVKTRIKSLNNITKLYKDNPDELTKIYNLTSFEIFELLYKGLISFKKSSFYLNLSSGDEIGNIFRLLKKFINHLSNLKCRAFFYNFRDKIILICYYSLNTIVQLKIRMRTFKILLKILDVLLIFEEMDQGLVEVFQHSIEFTLYEKINEGKFLQNIPHNNYSLENLIKDHKIQNDVTKEIYGEWIKQMQESSRNIAEDKLLNFFFKFWLETPEKIKRWFNLIFKTWAFPIFGIDIVGNEGSFYKVLSPLKTKFLERILTALHRILLKNEFEENFISLSIFEDIMKIMGTCSKELKIWDNLYEIYLELFQEKSHIKINNIDEEKFLISLMYEIKSGASSEIDTFSFSRVNNNEFEENLFALTSLKKILQFILEMTKYEKSYALIDELVFIIFELILSAERKHLMDTIHSVINPIIKNCFLIVLKWEDYLKNSWQKLKVLMRIFFKYTSIFQNIEQLIILKTEDIINQIYHEENLVLFESILLQEEIKPEFFIQVLLYHHNENCDCSFANEIYKTLDFKKDFLLKIGREEVWDKDKQYLYKKFKKWLHLILFLQDEEFLLSGKSFLILALLFQKIINVFMCPEIVYLNEKHKKQNRNTAPLIIFIALNLILFKQLQIINYLGNFRDLFQKNYRLPKGILIICKIFFELLYETRYGDNLFPKELTISFLKLVFIILSNYHLNSDWKLLNMICINSTSKLLSLNQSGMKLLIPHYIQIARNIIVEEEFNCNEYIELHKIIEVANFEIAINQIRFKSVDILKLAYGLSSNFSTLNDINNPSKKFGENKKTIHDISLEIFKKVAEENESYKNFEISLKENIFTLFFLILKDFEEEFFVPIWDLLIKTLALNTDNFYTLLSMILCKNLCMYQNQLPDSLRGKSYFKKMIETLIFKLGIHRNLTLLEIQILLDVILYWLLNYPFQKLDNKVLNFLTETLRILSKSNEILNNFEVFNSFFLKNVLNFPLKSQKKDNIHSIFNEDNFKYIDQDFLLIQGNSRFTVEQKKSTLSPPIINDDEFFNETKALERPFKRRASSFKTDEDEGNSNSNPASPLLKGVLNLQKENSKQKFVDSLLYYKEKQKIDKLNHNLVVKTPTQLQKQKIIVSLNKSSIITFLTSKTESKFYTITRNISGKFFWAFNRLQFQNKCLQFNLFSINQRNNKSLKGNCRGRRSKSFSYIKAEKEENNNMFSKFLLALNLVNEQAEMIDKQHFAYFNNQYMRKLKEKLTLSEKNERKIYIRKLLLTNNHNESLKNRRKSSTNNEFLNPNKTNFLKAQSFLQQLGFNPNSITSIDCNKNNDHLLNFLNIMDLTPERESIKVGVVYVAPEHKTQKEILKSIKGSIKYQKFLNMLGEKSALDKHLGYMAGLKPNFDGKYAIYYSDSFIEVIYHVATMMPSSEEDEQQIPKKRHIGNDSVNIIWYEGPRDYQYSTIISHFTSIYIIIYPLKNDLYRIQISRKNHIPHFFPCIDNLIVKFEDLEILIRIAAINGSRMAREINATSAINIPKNFLLKSNDKNLSLSVSQYNCYLERKKLINEMIQKFSSQNTNKDLYSYSFFKSHV